MIDFFLVFCVKNIADVFATCSKIRADYPPGFGHGSAPPMTGRNGGTDNPRGFARRFYFLVFLGTAGIDMLMHIATLYGIPICLVAMGKRSYITSNP